MPRRPCADGGDGHDGQAASLRRAQPGMAKRDLSLSAAQQDAEQSGREPIMAIPASPLVHIAAPTPSLASPGPATQARPMHDG
jgi:hypothetical protein